METLQRMANRGSISTGYDIDNSVKLETANNEWFYNASPTAGNRRTFTFSFWIKRTALGTINASGTQFVAGQGQHGRMHFSGDYFQFRFDDGHDVRDMTTKHRDTAAWLHVVVAVDTNQSSSSNRVKIYFNGVQTTTIDFDGGSYPDIEDQGTWFNTNYLTVGTAPFAGSYSGGDGDYDMSGYLADFAAVDGTQYAPTAFGEFDEDSGIWKPKDLSDITWGDEGFYLKFDDSSSLGADSSGNSNNLTVNNIAAADQSTDTPTNNFCTWNPLVTNAGVFTYTEGATKWKPSSGNWQTTTASMGFTKGKWYAEFKMDGDVTSAMVGVQQLENDTTYDGYYLGYHTNTTSMGMGYYNADGNVYRNGGNTTYGASFPSSVLVGVALEFKDDGTANMYVAKDNVWQNSGDPANGTNGFALNYGNAVDDSGFFSFASSLYQNPGYWQANFGSYTTISISSAASDANGYGTFEYAPPTGYYALCTKNLSEFGG
jgi:hypothetical protein